MADYSVLPLKLIGTDAFSEASDKELRLLLALIELEGRAENIQGLAQAAGISKARAASALVFWEEAGVISKASRENFSSPSETDEPSSETKSITEEFEERTEISELIEVGSLKVAAEIRDNNLADLISECARLMQTPALSTEEVKKITALYTQYALSEEYIITLAAHILEKNGKLTVTKLAMDAERLAKKGIDKVEDLEAYITDRAKENSSEWEFKRLVGIRGRNLSDWERELVNKWYYDYAFSSEIIGKAYDFTTQYADRGFDMNYMNGILTKWHEAGAKTLEDCISISDAERERLDAEKTKKKAPPKMLRSTKQAPRYGNFDVEDAFEKALQRSYGKLSEDDSEK